MTVEFQLESIAFEYHVGNWNWMSLMLGRNIVNEVMKTRSVTVKAITQELRWSFPIVDVVLLFTWIVVGIEQKSVGRVVFAFK